LPQRRHYCCGYYGRPTTTQGEGYAAQMNGQKVADSRLVARRMAICVASSFALIVLSLALPDSGLSAVLCFGIAIVSALVLLVCGVSLRSRQRLSTLLVAVAYICAAILLKANYSLARDHVRWVFLSDAYKAKVLAQPPSEELKHVEWDAWGFAAVANTTAFLVFDPTDSLADATVALPPITARTLPCEVVRVRRLDRQWYIVLFYTDMYWGQDACK
jgi:hypothetical protein